VRYYGASVSDTEVVCTSFGVEAVTEVVVATGVGEAAEIDGEEDVVTGGDAFDDEGTGMGIRKVVLGKGAGVVGRREAVVGCGVGDVVLGVGATTT
jgi:hypothetical protein